MKKEELTALGLDEETAKKVEAASIKELEEVNNAKKEVEKQLTERDSQLEELKKSTGDNESLKTQINQLQEENRAAKEKYDADLKDTKLTAAIKLAIAGKVHDEDLTAGQFDKTKLILSEDGKITGLDEQYKAIKEAKSFLFKPEVAAKGRQIYTPKDGELNEPSLAKSIAESMNAETSNNPYAKAWG